MKNYIFNVYKFSFILLISAISNNLLAQAKNCEQALIDMMVVKQKAVSDADIQDIKSEVGSILETWKSTLQFNKETCAQDNADDKICVEGTNNSKNIQVSQQMTFHMSLLLSIVTDFSRSEFKDKIDNLEIDTKSNISGICN